VEDSQLAKQSLSTLQPTPSRRLTTADRLRDRMQQNFRQVQEAYGEYAKYLKSSAESDDDKSIGEEPGEVAKLDEQAKNRL
jgi:hypothetical protein